MKNRVRGKNRRVLALIPARGGSKGIPRKNIASLGGRPLISYTIEAALRAQTIDRVVVTTDDEEIASTSRKWGAEIPCLRPMELASDQSELRSALFHMLDFLEDQEAYAPDLIATLFVTYPFRSAKDIDRCVQDVLQGALFSATVSSTRSHPYQCFLPVNGHVEPMVDQQRISREISEGVQISVLNCSINVNPTFPRAIRDLRDYTAITRAFNQYSAELVEREEYTGECVLHEVDRIRSVDIDTPEQLNVAEKILEHGLFHFDEGFYEHGRDIRHHNGF